MRTPGFWQDNNLASFLLSPLSYLYGLGAAFDRRFSTPQQAPLPVISIGNATAGGAGKTPTAIALTELLRSMGHAPHLITRGYGGKTRRAHHVETTDDWQQVGDEALLLAQHAPTWVARKRLDSAQAAKTAGASLVIADDALQHHALKKDISFLVVDGGFGFGNGRLLPAGPLREPLEEALKRTDAVILIGSNAQQLKFDKPVFTARLVPPADSGWIRNTRLLAFAGIARPQKFYESLQMLGGDLIRTHDFPDHASYSPEMLRAITDSALKLNATPIATPKDAVKFPPEFRDKIRILDIALRFDDPAGLQNWLQSRLPSPI